MNTYNNKKDLDRIIKRYIAGKANAEEIIFIEAYYEYLDQEKKEPPKFSDEELDTLVASGFKSVLTTIEANSNAKANYPFYRYIAAAVILMAFIIASLYLPLNPTTKEKNYSAKNIVLDVSPGVDKAMLTLGDGSKIVLDDAMNENIVEKTGLTISKTTSGQLVYRVSGVSPKTDKILYNTISTSKGNQYQVLLEDGTRVWLNAASSLKYPEFFTGNERKVTLIGEAYFEVAKNSAMPFIVVSGNQEVRVLGTHFNVNGYNDNNVIKTTLIEGSIKVSNENFAKILKAGEQSLTGSNGLEDINVVKNIDVEVETAWKNGLFNFNNAELKSILHQLERWYDIKIDYQSIPSKRYNGMVSRTAKLSEVLNMLELTGNITFKIEEGKRLKVNHN